MNPLLRWLTSPEWTHVVGALLHSLWQGAVIALALAGLMRWMVNPATRYRCALGALGLLGIASIVTWAWLNAPKSAAPIAASIPVTESTVAPVATAALNPDSTDKVVAFGRMSSPSAPTHWTAWLALVWMVGAAVMLLRAGIKVAGAENLRRSCQTLDDERMVALVAEARRAVGLARQIRVAVTDKLTSPAVVGVIVPTLILPLSLFTALTPEQIRFILLHELAHIRRGDYFANLFQLFAEALLFFNPAVWWVSHQIRREREACCDALAIELSGAPADYARTLVRVAENILHPATTAALAFGYGQREPFSLAERVQRLLVPGYRPALRLTWRAMLAALIVGGTLLVLSAVGTKSTVGAILSPRNTAAGNTPKTTSANRFANEDAFTLTNTVVRITNDQSFSVAEIFNLSKDGDPLQANPEGMLIFTNGARVKYNGEELTADILRINQMTGELSAEGNVRLETTNALGLADRIFGNIKSNRDRGGMGSSFWMFSPKTAQANQFDKQRTDQGVSDAIEVPKGYWEHFSQKTNEIPLPGGVIRGTSDEREWFHYVTGHRNGRQALVQKLDQIRLANYSCDKLPLKDVIRRLFEEARQRDPAKEGIGFAIAPPLLGRPPVIEVASIPITISPEHRETSLGTILYMVVQGAATPIDYSIRDNDVVFHLKNGAAKTGGSKTTSTASNHLKIGDPPFTLSDGNSTAMVNLNSASGMDGWKVDGESQLGQSLSGSPLGVRFFHLAPDFLSKATNGLAPEISSVFVTNPVAGFQALLESFASNDPRPRRLMYDQEHGVVVVRATDADLDKFESAIKFLFTTNYAVIFRSVPASSTAVELSTRTFAVGPIELARASGRVWPGYVTNAAEMVQAFMVKAGVDLQPPKTVFFKNTLGLLMVRATRDELDTIEKFLVQANQDAAFATLPSGKTAEARAVIPVPKNTPATSVSDGSTNLQLRVYTVDGNAMVQVLERQRGTKAGSGVKPITDGSQLLPEIQKLFGNVGVNLQPPKSVFFNETKGQLLVRATLADLDTIEHVVQVLNDQPPQVNIKVRWVEIPQSLVRSGLLPFLTNALPLPISRTQSLSGFLTEKQMAEVRKRIDSEDGMTLLSEGDVTTLTDRQAQIQTTEIRTIVTGINPKALTRPGVTATNNSGLEFLETQLMPFGPAVDLIPTVSRDQANISLRVIVTLSEFLGYSKTTSTVPVYVNGEEKMGFSPLPRYRVQQMIKDCVVPDEQTFFLGNPAITEVAKQPNGELLTTDVTGSKTNLLFVFVTPTLIDPAGNRVNLQGKSPPNSPPVSK